MAPLAVIGGPVEAIVFVGVIAGLMFIDMRLFARGREPTFKEGVWWSLGWLVLSLLVAFPILAANGSEAAVNYTTVYLIERSLSLDNLFVFLILFTYFGVPPQYRANLLFWGIAAALVLRGLAILGGVALIEQFHVVIYILGVTLLILAYRVLRGVDDNVDPDKNLFVRLTRRFFPVAGEFHGHHWFARIDGRRAVTPLFLCLAAIVFADIAFAVDSIPAAFAITRDSMIIWIANAFALLGLRALFVLVEGLIRRFRYLDETIAVVLAIVGVKLLIEDVVKFGPVVSLAFVVLAFTIGAIASVIADRRDPDLEATKAERDRRATGEIMREKTAEREAEAEAEAEADRDASRSS
jgi:tellurite resistance protein TerC